MHLALESHSIGPGDEVITPSMTWVSTVNLIVLAGATPVFADVDRETLMVTPDTVRACLSPRTRCIVPVHFAGAPADVEPMREMAGRHGAALVEDAAHALGAEYKGGRIGRHGVTIFSFHPIKNITTGEGGMFCCVEPDLADRIRRLRFHGLGVDAHDRRTQGRSPQAEVVEPGFKYNLTDVAAVLGSRQLARIEDMNAKRSALAGRYRERLSEIDEVLPLAEPAYSFKHGWHLYVIRVDTDRCGFTRDDFMEALKRRNIGTGLHFKAVHLQQYYAEKLNLQRGALPNTEWNSDRICSLPLFPDMTFDDVDDVVEAIKEVLRR
jgi:UDP-4-amino-4-deoxy-L-arabinose-oxoglutarate aminotransferase